LWPQWFIWPVSNAECFDVSVTDADARDFVIIVAGENAS